MPRDPMPRQERQVFTLRPGCKLNLWLRILSRRPDGYHELDTLFYPLHEPSDILHIELLPQGQGLCLQCNDPALAPEDNLVTKAYKAVAEATGSAPPLKVRLDKQVPVGAGLGGGSADCAAMLSCCNELAGDRRLPPEKLAELAAGLGADVPFFLQEHPAHALGIGERLRPVPTIRELLAGLWLLLACPQTRVSTSWAYQAWDQAAMGGGTHALHNSLTSTMPEDMSCFCFETLFLTNAFEPVVFPRYLELRGLKEDLLRQGAAAACMSGSGSSIFGLFRQEKAARKAFQNLSQDGVSVYMHGC
jgi:4-diphosphocytidyl-2-C-methyl-D-erythritol kinase